MKTEDCIFYQLAKTGQSAARFWAGYVEPLGLTAVQAMVLSFLREEDDLLSRELGERAGLDSATLTGILDRLENMCLIERHPNLKDRRAINICLSEKGKALSPKIEQLMTEANQAFLSGARASETEAFCDMLKNLRKAGARAGRLDEGK